MEMRLEDLVMNRYGPRFRTRQEKEDEEVDDYFKSLEAENARLDEEASLMQGPPVPPPPTYAETALGALGTAGTYISERAAEAARVAGERDLATQALTSAAAKGGVAAGETALQLGTGMIGGAVGAANFLEGVVRRAGETLPTRKYIEDQVAGLGPAGDPNYWKNLVSQSQKIASDFTYQPRTPTGAALSSAATAPLQALHYMSERAAQAPLSRMLFSEDQRHAIAYAHELLTMTAIGEIAPSLLGRGRTQRFRNEFQKAAQETQGGPITDPRRLLETPEASQQGRVPSNADALLASANEIITRAQENPQLMAKVEMVQGINPTLVPALRVRGREILTRLNENPDSVEYQTQAVSFFESARRVQDETTQQLRGQIRDIVDISGFEEMPRASRIARLREMQRPEISQKLSPLDQWMIRSESEALSEPTPSAPEVTTVPEISPTPALRATRRQRDLLRKSQEELFEPGEREAFEAGLPPRSIGEIRREYGIGYERARKIRESATDLQAMANRVREEPLVAATQRAVEANQRPVSDPIKVLQDISGKTPDEKIETAQSLSRIFTDKETTLKLIQDSLETGRDISAEISREVPGAVNGDFAVLKYKKAQDIARKGIKASENRGIMEIISDIAELFAFDIDPSQLGSNIANISLSHRQKMAAQRLIADAKKGEKSLNELIDSFTSDPDLRMTLRTYINSVDGAVVPPQSVPKNMPVDAQSASDPPISRRVRDNGKDAPPVYTSEARAVQEAPTSAPLGPSFFETPIRAAERYGQAIKEMTIIPYRRIKKATNDEIREMRNDLKDLRALAGYKSRREISAFQFGEGATLSPNAQRVLQTLEVGGGATIDRINAVRTALGHEEIPAMVDPLSFMRTFDKLKDNEVYTNLVTAPLDEIQLKLDLGDGIKYPSTLTQKALKMSTEKDIFQIYDSFTTRAVEQIKMAPLTEKLREIYNSPMPSIGVEGAKWNMRKDNPGLYNWMSKWTDGIEGHPNFTLGKEWDSALRAFNENLAFSMLSYSLSSAAAQPFSLINTMHKAGPINTLRSIEMSLESIPRSAIGATTSPRSLALGESKVLSSRADISVYADWKDSLSTGSMGNALQALREGRLKDASREGAKIGMVPLEILDLESAIIAYNAGKLQGRKLGLRGEALVDYADDMVIKTQGSGWRGDLAPIQRNALGKSVTQFQTYTISDFNFIMNDVLKIKKGMPLPEAVVSVGKFIGIVTAANVVADYFHINSPLPNPVREFSRSTGDPFTAAANAVFQTAMPYAPMIGSSRYGKGIGGPTLGTLFVDIPRGLTGQPGAPPLVESVAKAAGVPGTALFNRLMGKNEEDTRNIYDRLFNYEPPPTAFSGGRRRRRESRTTR